MRVTNFMIHNNSLNNIHRNMRNLARIYEQTTSQKNIVRPSQDPLIASRSLRFRTQLSNIEQFQQNVESGNAWMNVTEASFFNLVRGDANGSIFSGIQDRLLAAANRPVGALDDILVYFTEIENLMRQIGLEMNQTYAGRFVFAGWRTDQPPVLMRDMNDESHVITQHFNVRDIEHTYSFQRFPGGQGAVYPANEVGLPYHRRVAILKLPFRQSPADGNRPATGLTFGMGDTPAANVPPWTGEHSLMVRNPQFDPDIPPDPITNPEYIDLPNEVPRLGVFGPDGEPLEVTIIDDSDPNNPIETEVPVRMIRLNSSDIYAFRPDPDAIHYIYDTGELVLGSAVVEQFEDGITFRYQVDNLREGDLNPFVYFDTWSTVQRVNPTVPHIPNAALAPGNLQNAPPPNSHHWPRDPRQQIFYEFNVGSPIQVNSLAWEVYSANMFADLRRLMEFANNINRPDRRELAQIYGPGGRGYTGDALEDAITRHISDENAIIHSVLHNRINNMIRLMDEHVVDAAREHTSLGVRMRRVEMIQMRLEQDEGNITKLKSENEDVDMVAALTRQSIAEASFQGALRVIATSIELSLVQFV